MNDDRLKIAAYINLEPNTTWRADLCLYHENINIPKITQLLKCEPTEAHKKGDMIGKRKTSPAPVGLWSLQAPREAPFLNQIKYLLDNTTTNKEIWDDLHKSHNIQLRCSAFLHSWTDGFDIPRDVLTEIAKRHWLFGFSFYSAEGDEIVDSFLKRDPNFEKNLENRREADNP
jgi:hypothetical protein